MPQLVLMLVSPKSVVEPPEGSLLAEVRALASEGAFERAFELAKRGSVALVREGRLGDASSALALAAEILCTLNHPLRARALAQEAIEMAKARGDVGLERHARAVSVLALLRLGEIDKAEVEFVTALRGFGNEGHLGADPLPDLVGAEVALTTDKIREARALAESALAAASTTRSAVYKARASLILGVCALRDRAYKAALRVLLATLADLEIAPDVEILWQVHAALASVSRKLGRAELASQYQVLAAASAQGVADALSPDLRERFLGNPTVQAAIAVETTRSGWSQFPPEVRLSLAGAQGADPQHTLGPFLEAFRKLNAQRELHELLPAIVELMMELCGGQRGTIAIFDGSSPREEVSRAGEARGFQPYEMGVARAVLEIVRQTGRPFMADDVRNSPDIDVRADVLLSVLCVPICVHQRVLGAIYLDVPDVSGAFEQRDIEVGEILAHHGAVALENLLVHEHAIRDGLTLLYNQAHVEACLEREIAASGHHGRPCGVLMLDIDDFKRTNESMGHAAGSDVLRALATILSHAVRSLDVVARIEDRNPIAVVGRYGGDEFEIVLPDTGPEGLAVVAGRIVEAMREATFPFGDRLINVTVSIGGACFPGDAGSAQDLMRRADEALYQAKQAGKNRYRAYQSA